MSIALLGFCLFPYSLAGFQRDAPRGRWLNGDRPPKTLRFVNAGSVVACPTVLDFCIDTRWSDEQTCLHPNPHLIKRCLDESCIRSPFGKARAAQELEDTYCKDFMSHAGRFCQWTEQYRCTCAPDVEDIVYANGIVLNHGDDVPAGYAPASECVYPSDNIKRMPNGAYVDIRVPGGPPVPRIPDDPKLKGDILWLDADSVPTGTVRPLAVPAQSSGSTNIGIVSVHCALVAIIFLLCSSF